MMVFKKGHKPVKKGQKMSDVNVEIEVKKEENVGTTVVENEINDVANTELTNIQQEIENEQIGNKEKGKNEKGEKIMGTIGGNTVVQPKGQIRFEAQVAPVPMFKVPADIRQYLINNGFTTDVWRKDKEWLEKHNADMNMIAKLKDFLTSM